jgi:N-acyl-D-amino-acid deacylase
MSTRFRFSTVRQRASWLLAFACLALAGPALTQDYDVLIRGGTVCDGSGDPCVLSDVAIAGERIAAVGSLGEARADAVIDASGLVVAPGFINMLSWGVETLLVDGRGQGDIRQGVTLEVFGEGISMGPLTPEMKAVYKQRADYDYDVTWTSLGEYLEHLEARGVSPNVASFVGATTVRIHELGYADRAPSPEELAAMQALVREAMEEGALGVGSSLIYAPAFYADTDELVALVQAAAEYGGMYISHMRSEGNRLLEALEELIEIAERSGAPAEIYHLKMGGRSNWDKYDAVVRKVEAARERGIRISADMYTYTAGSTGLDAAMPPWVQEGGHEAWTSRLKDPAVRARLVEEMTKPTDDWENLMLAAGADKTLLVGFRNPVLGRQYTGKTLAEVAAIRGTSPAEAAMDLVVEDGSRVQVVYFLMSEENVRKLVALPWMSFGSDAEAMATEGVFLERSTHPRAYGNFARVLGKYVREEKLLPLGQAIHKLSQLPATNLGIRERGSLKPGYFADVVVFDPKTVTDHATYSEPHRYATGMEHVFVNGTRVLAGGEHTGALPGKAVRGPGWRGWKKAEVPAAIHGIPSESGMTQDPGVTKRPRTTKDPEMTQGVGGDET